MKIDFEQRQFRAGERGDRWVPWEPRGVSWFAPIQDLLLKDPLVDAVTITLTDGSGVEYRVAEQELKR